MATKRKRKYKPIRTKAPTMLRASVKGDFSNTESFLEGLRTRHYLRKLDKYGKKGLKALESATPVDTGITADSWTYKVDRFDWGIVLSWTNSNMAYSPKHRQGVPIVLLLHFGHATRNGGYVPGSKFLTTTMEPIFEEIIEDLEAEVTKL